MLSRWLVITTVDFLFVVRLDWRLSVVSIRNTAKCLQVFIATNQASALRKDSNSVDCRCFYVVKSRIFPKKASIWREKITSDWLTVIFKQFINSLAHLLHFFKGRRVEGVAFVFHFEVKRSAGIMLQLVDIGRICNVFGLFLYEVLKIKRLLAIIYTFLLFNMKTSESCPRNLRSTILLVYLNVVVRLFFLLGRTKTPTKETLWLH